MLKSRLLGAVGIVAVVGGVLAAQTPSSEPTFDVVSVKLVDGPNPSPPGSSGFLPGGRYVVGYTNLENLLGVAYRPSGFGSLGLDHIDISHVATWVHTSLFRIEARVSPPPADWGAEAVGQPFLRSMLRDRFKLQAHFEKRPLPLYWMTVARADGALGPSMKAVEPYDCAGIARARRENPSAVLMPHPGHPVCLVMSVPNHIAGGSVTPAMLAQALRGPVGAPVVDHTGLTGVFDVDIFYTSQAQGLAPPDPASAAQIARWPTLITAIQDQLGLKLERQTEPQDVLVVDHVEPPTPN